MPYHILSEAVTITGEENLTISMDCILPCIMCTHVFGPNFQEKNLSFSFLIQLFIYLYLDSVFCITKGIILHTDIIIAF